MHFNVCQVLARNYKKDGTKNGSPPALAFIIFNPAVFSEVLIQLLHCVPLNT